MKKFISGLVVFITAVAAILVGLVAIHDSMESEEEGLFLAGILGILVAFNVIIYVVWTNFGRPKSSLELIKDENEIIKLKIEQQELKKRLDS